MAEKEITVVAHFFLSELFIDATLLYGSLHFGKPVRIIQQPGMSLFCRMVPRLLPQKSRSKPHLPFSLCLNRTSPKKKIDNTN